MPPGQYESSNVKKFLSITWLASRAASKPKNTSIKVATKLWRTFLIISLKVLSANLHPTDDPSISNEKFIIFGGNLYEAIPNICKKPLAISVPESKAAGTLSLLNI